MKYTVLLTDGRAFAMEAAGYSYSSPYLCLHDADGKVIVGVRDPVLFTTMPLPNVQDPVSVAAHREVTDTGTCPQCAAAGVACPH